MACKTFKARIGFHLAVIPLSILSLSSVCHASKPYRSTDSTYTRQIAYLSNSIVTTGEFLAPDGNTWRAVYVNNSEFPKMIFGCSCHNCDGDAEMIAYNFLEDNSLMLGIQDVSEMKYLTKSVSPGSTHITYRQDFNGLPVFDSVVSIHVNHSGYVELVTNEYQNLENPIIKNSGSIMGPEAVLSIVERDLGNAKKDGKVEQNPGLIKVGDDFVRVWRITYPTIDPIGDWVYDIDAESGAILRKVNAVKFADAQGYVYVPNPFATGERQNVTLKNLLHKGNQYILKGLFFDIMDSTYALAQEEKPVFDYEYIFDERVFQESKFSDPRYEQVLLYHLLESYRNYSRSLGFQLFNNYKISADAHGTNEDISFYSSARRKLIYGCGGINDASDGDVILHELGHAILDFVKPDLTAQGGETAAMHEGYSDYFAASYFDDPCIAEWDARYTSQTGCERRTDNTKTTGDKVEEEHDDGEIWSGFLWDVRSSISTIEGKGKRDIPDQLVLKSIYYLPDSQASFKEGVCALLIADKNLFSQKYSSVIKKAALKRKIMTDGDAMTLASQ